MGSELEQLLGDVVVFLNTPDATDEEIKQELEEIMTLYLIDEEDDDADFDDD